ncbi:uncharacterized protein [Ptychodera flava]|uniref:uncharacterized protein n=1 Tax=Ptychodera flava TaxID=63121 RepID=UPI00396A4218
MNRVSVFVFTLQSLAIFCLIQQTQSNLFDFNSILNWKREDSETFPSDHHDKNAINGKFEKLVSDDSINMDYLELIDFFSWLDLNKDGLLTHSEIAIVEKFSEPKIVWDTLKTYESNGDGKVDLEEFLKALLREKKQQIPSLEEILEVFGMFDADKDGLIRLDEIKDTMAVIVDQDLTDDQISDILRVADTDGSGAIDLNEFAMSISIIE